MNLYFAAFSLLPAGAGLVFRHMYQGTVKKIEVMNATPPSTAAEIVSKPLGTLVEMMGTLRCSSLLTSEFTQAACAYYDVSITREEDYWTTGSDGKQERNTRTINVYSKRQHAPCQIEDATGSVAVDLETATVEAVASLSRRGKPTEKTGFSGLLDTLGHANDHYYENILPPDAKVFVLGEVGPGGVIGAPKERSAGREFVVSVKSKDQRANDMTRSGKWSRFGMIVCGVLFAGLLVVGLVT